MEDFRNHMNDSLGQSKNLGQGSGTRPKDMIYGKSSRSNKSAMIVAGDVIRGNYKDEDNMPDHDLGKSITPGFRNVVLEVYNFHFKQKNK